MDARFGQSERRWEERDRRWEERDREMRAFMDALTRRHVEVTQEMIAELGRLGERMDANSACLQAEIADQRDQIQANTKALLRLLDERFGPERPQG